jgi:hypothetical protein
VDVYSPTDLSITPQAASEFVILPTTPPLGAHHDSQEPNDSNELGSRHHALELDPSSENRDLSDNSS